MRAAGAFLRLQLGYIRVGNHVTVGPRLRLAGDHPAVGKTPLVTVGLPARNYLPHPSDLLFGAFTSIVATCAEELDQLVHGCTDMQDTLRHIEQFVCRFVDRRHVEFGIEHDDPAAHMLEGFDQEAGGARCPPCPHPREARTRQVPIRCPAAMCRQPKEMRSRICVFWSTGKSLATNRKPVATPSPDINGSAK